MTKRTPLQEYRTALEKRRAAEEKARREFEARRLKAVERPKADRDKIIRAETDPSLSSEERLEIFKGLQGWPRIVLGLYEAERENITAADRGKPSDIAYEKVGEVVSLGPDRIKALCNQARRHLKEGMPAGFVVKMTAAEFERQILRRDRKRTV
jgi:hypothetical protein